MDPTRNLQEQLELAREIRLAVDGETNVSASEVWAKANRLSELVLALDSWLRRQGFPPSQWKSLHQIRMEAMQK